MDVFLCRCLLFREDTGTLVERNVLSAGEEAKDAMEDAKAFSSSGFPGLELSSVDPNVKSLVYWSDSVSEWSKGDGYLPCFWLMNVKLNLKIDNKWEMKVFDLGEVFTIGLSEEDCIQSGENVPTKGIDAVKVKSLFKCCEVDAVTDAAKKTIAKGYCTNGEDSVEKD